MTYQIHLGNSLDILPTLPAKSVDSIVTDPPYELGFMGKSWDSTGIAYDVELWRECLRVLKPGGHLLAFSASRTYHRMTVAIEDAGFEIRDMISWISNKTFPKSLNISKAIDKGTGENRQRQLKFTAWMRSTGITARQIDDITNTKMGSHYTTHPTQPAIATADLFDKLRPYLPEVPEEIERLVAERTGIEWTAYKNRKVIGQKTGAQSESTGRFGSWGNDDGTGKSKYNETLSATQDAKKWEGWGTGLKPTVEPIVMARKPVEGTVANNVLTYGTGGLNIDASRIGTDEITTTNGKGFAGSFEGGVNTNGGNTHIGRWPANVILDEDSAEILDQQSGNLKSGNIKPHTSQNTSSVYGNGKGYSLDIKEDYIGDTGGASRFFYVAKASKRDRNEGLKDLPDGYWELQGHQGNKAEDGISNKSGTGTVAGFSKNHHPTVKPTSLMTYLIKLVTPPGGTVLDPFTGSGSTGKAAVLEGFDFIGVEMTEEYLPIIKGRLAFAEKVFTEKQDTETEKLF